MKQQEFSFSKNCLSEYDGFLMMAFKGKWTEWHETSPSGSETYNQCKNYVGLPKNTLAVVSTCVKVVSGDFWRTL
jgi:hypothetical protein